jgi:hypothetical protein
MAAAGAVAIKVVRTWRLLGLTRFSARKCLRRGLNRFRR